MRKHILPTPHGCVAGTAVKLLLLQGGGGAHIFFLNAGGLTVHSPKLHKLQFTAKYQ